MAERFTVEEITKTACDWLESIVRECLSKQHDKDVQYYESVVIPQKVAEAKKELIEKIGKIATFDKECSHTICSAEKYEEPCNLESYCPYRIWQQLKKDEEIE